MKDSGLILKNYLPDKYKVAILNDRGERFEAVASAPTTIEKLRPGYRITYTLLSNHQFSRLDDIEIIFVPKAVNYESLQFLHQVLAICMVIVPEGQVALEVVELLKILTSYGLNDWSLARRRLLICCLLSALGFYSELNEYELIYKMGQISRIAPSDFMEFKIDFELDQFLINWIVNFVNINIAPRFAVLFASIYQN